MQKVSVGWRDRASTDIGSRDRGPKREDPLETTGAQVGVETYRHDENAVTVL